MFKNSAAVDLTPHRLTEQSANLPLDIFPSFIGSGLIGIALDGSGLQGLNNRMNAPFGFGPDTSDIYIFGSGYVSNHLSEDNLMPLGHLDWSLEFNGNRYGASALPAAAHNWSRETDIGKARITTQMTIANAVDVRLGLYTPIETRDCFLQCTLSRKPEGTIEKKPPVKNVSFRLILNLNLRNGKPVYDNIAIAADTGQALTMVCHAAGHESYDVPICVSADRGALSRENSGHTVVVEFACPELTGPQTVNVCVSFAGRRMDRGDFDRIEPAHQSDWADYHRDTASFSGTDDIRMEYLFNLSKYLLRSGMNFRQGYHSSFLFNHPPWWKASVFWDLHVIADGALRSNRVRDVVESVTWLKQIMRPSGRPFPWMMRYDGTATIKSAEDPAIFCCTALAMIAIRLYETTRDQRLLADLVFPICERVSGFFLPLYQEENGKWVLASATGHDVGAMTETVTNDTFTSLWTMTLFRKTIEYSRLLGKPLDDRYRRIVDHVHFEQDATEYFSSKNIKAGDHAYASFVANYLYPTENTLDLELGLMKSTRAKYDFPSLYMEKQGDRQAWGFFWQASSDFRLGMPEEAFPFIQRGLFECSYGPGYLMEVGPKEWGLGTMPPYATAHGQLLVTLTELFVMSSLWENRVSFFGNLPDEWKARTLAFTRMRTINGLVCSGMRAPDRFSLVLEGNGEYAVEILFPPDGSRRNLTIAIDGTPGAVDEASGKEPLSFQLNIRGKVEIQGAIRGVGAHRSAPLI